MSSDAQLADGLTKASAFELLQKSLQGGQIWVVKYDPEFLAAKKKKKLHALSHDSEEQELNPDLSFHDLMSKQHTIYGESFWGMSDSMLSQSFQFTSDGMSASIPLSRRHLHAQGPLLPST